MKNEQTDTFLCLENVSHFEIQIVVAQVEKIKSYDISFIIQLWAGSTAEQSPRSPGVTTTTETAGLHSWPVSPMWLLNNGQQSIVSCKDHATRELDVI